MIERERERRRLLLEKAAELDRQAEGEREQRLQEWELLRQIDAGETPATATDRKAVNRRVRGCTRRLERLERKAARHRAAAEAIDEGRVHSDDPRAEDLLDQQREAVGILQQVMRRVNYVWRKWGGPDPFDEPGAWEMIRRELYMSEEELQRLRDQLWARNRKARRRCVPYPRPMLLQMDAKRAALKRRRDAIVQRKLEDPREFYFRSVGVRIWTEPRRMKVWLSFEHDPSPQLRRSLGLAKFRHVAGKGYWAVYTDKSYAAAFRFAEQVGAHVA